MRTWWPSIVRQSQRVTGLSLLLLVTLGTLAFLPSGSFDDLAAVSSQPECAYLKIFPWRNRDPNMIIPYSFGEWPNPVPEPSLTPHVARIATPVHAPGLSPESFPDTISSSPDCHPIPQIVPISPATH